MVRLYVLRSGSCVHASLVDPSYGWLFGITLLLIHQARRWHALKKSSISTFQLTNAQKHRSKRVKYGSCIRYGIVHPVQ